MNKITSEVRVGTSLLIFNDDKLLLGERCGSHGANTFAPPGGHIEFGETPEQCAQRELKEETNLDLIECRRGPWTNDFFEQEQKHYITLYLFTKVSGTLKLLEPEKCLSWKLYSFDALPSPLFLPIQNLLNITTLQSTVVNSEFQL